MLGPEPTQQWVSMTFFNVSGANLYAKIRVLGRDVLALVDTGSANILLDAESFSPPGLKGFKPVSAMLADDYL